MDKDQVKLKVVAEEIKEILRKHDVAGAVALHTPGYGENFMHLNPSYSCAYMIEDSEIRFYAKRADFKTSEEQWQKIADTSNMLKMLLDLSGFNFMGLEHLSKTLDAITGLEHTQLKKL